MELANPILIKEMRTRMRGKRAFAIVTTYSMTLGLILGLFYWAISAETRGPQISGMGLYLATTAVFVQMALICLISPTFAASAISSEREQQTFELLVASLATPWSILVGKVGASLCYLFLVLLGSLPIISFVYWIGGISLGSVAICYLVMVVSGVTYCTISFLWSTLLRRAVLAQMVSMFTVIVLVIGIPALTLFLQIMASLSAGTSASQSFFWANLVMMLLRTNPFYAQGDALFGNDAGAGASSTIWLHWVPVWVFQCGFYLALTVVAAFFAWLRLGAVRRWLT